VSEDGTSSSEPHKRPYRPPTDPIHQNLIGIATAGRHESKIQRLLDYGADSDYTDAAGLTAMHHAAYHGHAHVVRALIADHADVNAFHDCYGTPLCLAAVTSNVPLVDLLLAGGANPESPAGWLGSALHCACASIETHVFDRLIAAGGTLRDCTISKSLVRKLSRRESAILEPISLERRVYSWYNNGLPTALAAMLGHTNLIKRCIELGDTVNGHYDYWEHFPTARPYITDTKVRSRHFGITYLMATASDRHCEALSYLVQMGADPLAQDGGGLKALHHLVRSHAPVDDGKRAQMIGLLCQNPGDIDTCDGAGWTALHKAVYVRSYDFVKALIEYGADPDKVNDEGQAARDLYRESNPFDRELEELWNKKQRST